MKRIIFTLLLVIGISFAYQDLDSKTFYETIQKEKDIIILDVRTPQEYEKDGHIPGSILIPVQVLPQYIKDLEKFKNKKILVYCRSGNRSSLAAKFLEQNGFKNVYNLKNGIIDWKKQNLPVEYGMKK
ncbi:rhodanese-like domain-containing protein [Sulfurihydrogenibium sp.]|uniref:rhodanese-like domain-containing protein n=1 Tax=Sulfurihydrogenibium sp. TaxID=2053621 RepID=UPI00261413D5|nr:rhodanese-like domain-containing protein [Sulfurihydrogenibium sp.]